MEVSHQPTHQREDQLRRCKSPGYAQRLLSVHGPINTLFGLGRHVLINRDRSQNALAKCFTRVSFRFRDQAMRSNGDK